MADNTSVNTNTAASGATIETISTDDIGGVKVQRVKVQYGTDGNATDVSSSNPLPVTASALPLPSGAATEATLSTGNTQRTAGNASLASIDGKVPALVSGRVPVDGSGVTQPVSGPLTDTQLRASAVPVSAASLPLPSGAATETTLSSINTKTPGLVGGSQPVVPRDASGNAYNSITHGAGFYAQMTGQGPTNYIVSTANSSTAQLAASATFAGAVEDCLASQALSVLMTSDQPSTITIDFFIDASGTYRAGRIQETVAANAGYSKSFVANGNYYRVSVQNTGASTTTTFNLNSALGILPPTTSRGNVPGSINEVNGTALSLGQTTMSASIPVTIASNQSSLAVTSAGIPSSIGPLAPSASQSVTLPNDVTVGAAASIAALNTDLLTGNASGWYDAANFHSVAIQIIGSAGISAGAITFEQTNDTSVASAGNLWAVDEITSATPTPNLAAVTIAASTTRMFSGAVIARYVRVRVSTGFAGGNVQAVAIFSQLPPVRYFQTVHQATAANLNATVTATNLSCNVAQLAGQVPLNPVANGSTNRVFIHGVATAISNTDQNATAYAGTGRVNGTVVAAATGAGGAVITAEINVTALTLGAATGIVFVLQESNGGTNFTDIWVSDPIAATGIIRVPAIPVGGRRRWCAHSVGGASTTVTTTITTLELPPGSYPWTRQYRDSYAATAAMATVINSVTQTASTFGAATALTATTQATPWCVVEGCKVLSATMTLGSTPTVTTQPVVSIELSNDLTNILQTSSTMTATGPNTYSVSLANVAFRYARLRVTTAAAYSAGAYTVSNVGILGVN